MKTIRNVVLVALTAVVSLTAADVKNGQAVYNKSCKSCHGADGTAPPNMAKMFKVDMRPLASPEVQGLSDDQIKNVIENGQGKMHAVKTVTGASLDDVVAYVRSLKK